MNKQAKFDIVVNSNSKSQVSPVKWVLFEEGNLEVGRSDARMLVGPNILGALKHLVCYSFHHFDQNMTPPNLLPYPWHAFETQQGQISTLGGETRVGVGIP